MTSPLLLAQEVVHAVQGTLTTINTTAHSITVVMSDGTQTTYQDETKRHPDLEFEKKLRGQSVDVGSFNKHGNQVVVYYFGGGTRPTAVAVKDLGAQALTTVSGYVVKSERHSISLKTAKGDMQMFQIAPTATVETSEGAVEAKIVLQKRGPMFQSSTRQAIAHALRSSSQQSSRSEPLASCGLKGSHVDSFQALMAISQCLSCFWKA